MIEKIRLYFKLVGISVRSQMQHRASFLMLAAAHFIATFAEIVGIWVLFDRFKMVQGWTLEELALVYGVVHMGFALAESLARGFDNFSGMVKNGDFDRVLLRPCGTLLQIAASEVQVMRVGRFLQGFIVLLWSCHMLQISLLSLSTFVILLAIIGTASLFYALFIIQATLAFWTTETLELMNILTYGGVECGQYPITVFNKGFRLFFTLIIPLACVTYYPIAVMLHHEHLPVWLGMLAPLAGIVFLIVACQGWKLGVRHYHSTGS